MFFSLFIVCVCTKQKGWRQILVFIGVVTNILNDIAIVNINTCPDLLSLTIYKYQ